ncbi:MAG: four helix bundle protein [Candidatus Komeilibacteria bacterium]
MHHSEHNAYKLSYELANIIWSIVADWKLFEKQTIGNQLVRSTDSISSNIAEGWARYYKKDKILFFNYARSSLAECQCWILKAVDRRLIVSDKQKEIDSILLELPKELNGLIKGTKENLKY